MVKHFNVVFVLKISTESTTEAAVLTFDFVVSLFSLLCHYYCNLIMLLVLLLAPCGNRFTI